MKTFLILSGFAISFYLGLVLSGVILPRHTGYPADCEWIWVASREVIKDLKKSNIIPVDANVKEKMMDRIKIAISDFTLDPSGTLLYQIKNDGNVQR